MTPPRETRHRMWAEVEADWDLVIIGGGITGAGLFHEAARAGVRCLLLEAHDFGSGTSSRSSKLVHGGARYMKNLQFHLTFESVRERDRLVRQAPGLVHKLPFMLTNYRSDPTPAWMYAAGFALFDWMAGKWEHERLAPANMLARCPQLNADGLESGILYFDAETDDSRLVYRLTQEGRLAGGLALNYARVAGFHRSPDRQVRGVQVFDTSGESLPTVRASAAVVVNATGAWADSLRQQLGRGDRLRLLRGAHLIFSGDRFPLQQAISLLHPVDRRLLFAIPWEGGVVFGTTDLDLAQPMTTDLAITQTETDYLFAALDHSFPGLALGPDDVVSTFAGVRSVIDTGKTDPSRESREHAIWQEDGLVTVTGGKLTIFRRMAHDVLRHIRHQLPGRPSFDPAAPILPLAPALPADAALLPAAGQRLVGRLGTLAVEALAGAADADLLPIGGTPTVWAEIGWAARAESIVHLEDILLRRTRLGLLLPDGGAAHHDRLRAIVQPALGWDDDLWRQEWDAYQALCRRCHNLPQPG